MIDTHTFYHLAVMYSLLTYGLNEQPYLSTALPCDPKFYNQTGSIRSTVFPSECLRKEYFIMVAPSQIVQITFTEIDKLDGYILVSQFIRHLHEIQIYHFKYFKIQIRKNKVTA